MNYPVKLNDSLSGARILLRSPRADDAPTLHTTYFSDPQCARFLKRLPLTGVRQTRHLLERLGAALNANNEKPFAWVIANREDDRPIGLVTCIPESRSVQIHYGLAKEKWGSGLAVDSVKLACGELFRIERFDRIFTICAVAHLRSLAVLQRCGFELEAYLPEALVLPAFGCDPQDGAQYARYRARRAGPVIQFPLPVSG